MIMMIIIIIIIRDSSADAGCTMQMLDECEARMTNLLVKKMGLD